MFGVITSWTAVPDGSQQPAVARTVMSRSVSMPTRRSLSPQTGSAPTFNSRIFSAARAMLSAGRAHSTPRVITSLTCMIVSFRSVAGLPRGRCAGTPLVEVLYGLRYQAGASAVVEARNTRPPDAAGTAVLGEGYPKARAELLLNLLAQRVLQR